MPTGVTMLRSAVNQNCMPWDYYSVRKEHEFDVQADNGELHITMLEFMHVDSNADRLNIVVFVVITVIFISTVNPICVNSHASKSPKLLHHAFRLTAAAGRLVEKALHCF